jgi:hypothetical protein
MNEQLPSGKPPETPDIWQRLGLTPDASAARIAWSLTKGGDRGHLNRIADSVRTLQAEGEG